MHERKTEQQFPWPIVLKELSGSSLPAGYKQQYSLQQFIKERTWEEFWPQTAKPGTEGWMYARDATVASYGLRSLAEFCEHLAPDHDDEDGTLHRLSVFYSHLHGLAINIHALLHSDSRALFSPQKIVRNKRNLTDPVFATERAYAMLLGSWVEFDNLEDTYTNYTLAIINALFLSHSTAVSLLDENHPIGPLWYHIKELFLGAHNRQQST